MTFVKASVHSEMRGLQAIRRHGGLVRTSQAAALGISSNTLYALHKTNRLTQLSRGLYRLAELPEIAQPDLVVVAAKAPTAVFCLLSALSWHEITTAISSQ